MGSIGGLSEITEWSGAGSEKRGKTLKGPGGVERKKSIPLLLTTQVYQKKIK